MATRSGAISARTRAPRRKVSTAALHLGHPAVLVGVICGVLVILGLVMILSASSVSSFATYGSSFLFFRKQVLGVVLGVIAYFVFARLDYRVLKRWGFVLVLVSLGLL